MELIIGYFIPSFANYYVHLISPSKEMKIPARTQVLFLLLVLFDLDVLLWADLIADTCRKTIYPGICVSTLRSNPRSAGANVTGLVRIVFDTALPKANSTLNLVNELYAKALKAKQTSFFEYLSNCLNQYKEAVSGLNGCTEYLGSDNFGTVLHATQAVSYVLICEKEFIALRPIGGRASPITAQNNAMERLVSIALGIVKSLGCNQPICNFS
ncbi:uncharacterized protein LOC131328747 [Rhododendron vialii]|uniref:uncharacterized protein LOC131328747 n=1 Tax=Rhododendron vialii TaxID=182163 RepID=UPI00265F4D27|nr:uncharacterized protein LOC131328747 [Rhododendron vialii]